MVLSMPGSDELSKQALEVLLNQPCEKVMGKHFLATTEGEEVYRME